MTTHVFIVDSSTFNTHLKYLFAGTGAKDLVVDFNGIQTTSLHYAKENNIVGMSADACRVRQGDKVIFYLQQDSSSGIYEGKFYGMFEVLENWSFFDNNDGYQYLLGTELEKSLFFRALLKPDKVYTDGVTEWEALDSIVDISSPAQMQWSLIYRKLKGNRGNTMITIYESEKLFQQIKNKNSNTELIINNKQLAFDVDTQKIVVLDSPKVNYTGRQVSINMLPRLVKKYNENKAFETHLQSYIVKYIGLGINNTLDESILDSDFDIEWLGNEVPCGVGMQRIDVAISAVKDEKHIFIPIELKAVEVNSDNVRQVSRYIDWIEQYYIPNHPSEINPVIISKKFNKSTTAKQRKYDSIIQLFNDFNYKNSERCGKISYIEYEVVNNDLVFSEILY